MSGARKILAVNTAGPAVEVALSCGGYFRDENGRNASVSLMPAIDKLLTDAGMALSELDAIACVIGPGSFTGIRIGVSAARAMCYALGKPAVAVNYLQSLAYNERADGFDKILCVCDGSNGTAYIAEFDSERKPLRETVCVTMGEAEKLARGYGGAVCACERTVKICENAIPPAPDCHALLRAAEAMFAKACDFKDLIPLYVRESQAEKDLKESGANARIQSSDSRR